MLKILCRWFSWLTASHDWPGCPVCNFEYPFHHPACPDRLL